MSRVPRGLVPLATIAAVGALGACGDSPQPAEMSARSSAASSAQDTARVKVAQCLREQGIDVPDGEQTSEAFARLAPAERRRAQAALDGPCKDYASQAFGDTHDPQSQEFLDALTSFTDCLRSNGADVADPDPADPFAVLHRLDQRDPTIAAALSTCQAKLPSANRGG